MEVNIAEICKRKKKNKLFIFKKKKSEQDRRERIKKSHGDHRKTQEGKFSM